MKLGPSATLDDIDRAILSILQSDCKTPLAKIGEKVGLSAPSVVERIRKLEAANIVKGYHSALDARGMGLDITAFIGVTIDFPKHVANFEEALNTLPEILECHHVTGAHTLLIKIKTYNTHTLEALISHLRALGTERTETMIALSTPTERSTLPLSESETALARRAIAALGRSGEATSEGEDKDGGESRRRGSRAAT